MPADSVDTLLDALEGSHVLSAAQAEECRRQQSGFADTKALAKFLLRRDWLTAYQVNQALQGKTAELALGQYVLLERIGQGGMGQVFKARHRIMNRVVALKVIRRERLSNPDLVKRFQREIELVATVAHPNIVTAYDALDAGGTHLLVMEFVEGTDLAKLVEKHGPRPVPQACDFIRQAALGLQHAHERGLVHRDIKPANLLLAVKENVVKVLDMGLARLNQSADADATAVGLTVEGSVMGTPDYMAPEQAEDSTTVDTRADVYSLGCTLYFLLTTKPPFPGGTLAQKLRKHATAEPAPVESVRPDVPPGLAAVVRKMMAKRPDERYRVPGEAAAALEAFCRPGPAAAVPVAAPAPSGVRPVAVPLPAPGPVTPHPVAVPAAVAAPAEAPPAAGSETVPPGTLDSVPSVTLRKPPSPLDRARDLWRRLGRNGQIAAAGAAALVLLALVIALWPRRKHKEPEPDPAPPEATILPEVADRPWMADDLKKMVVAVLGEHRVRHPGLTCFALRPDGKKVALGGTGGIILGDGDTLRRDDERHWLNDHTGAVNCLAYSADGKLLVSGGADRTVRLWDGESGKSLGPFKGAHDGPVNAVAITRDGKFVLSGGDDRKVRVWSVASREQVGAYAGHTTPVRAVAVTPDGTRAFSAGGSTAAGEVADRDVRSWDVATARDADPPLYTGHDGRVARLSVSPDGKQLVGASDSGPNVWLWDVGGAGKPATLPSGGTPNTAAGATFLADGRVATCAANGAVKVWETKEGRAVFTSPANLATNTLLACYPDHRIAFVAGPTVRVWDVEKKVEWRPPQGHPAAVTHLALGGSRWLLSGSQDVRLRLWALDTGKPHGDAFGDSLSNHTITGLAVTADGRQAVAVAGNSLARLWETATGRELRTFGPEDGKAVSFSAVALSPDGKRVLAADTGLWLWDADSRQLLRRPEGKHPDPVRQLAFAADAAHPRRAWSFDGGELRVWEDVEKGDDCRKLAVSGYCVALSADLDTAFTGQGDGNLTLWTELGTGKPKSWPFDHLHTSTVLALALSPDGKWLFSAGADERLIWWDLAEKKKKAEWSIPERVNALQFTPGGKRLVLGNGNATIYVLKMPE